MVKPQLLKHMEKVMKEVELEKEKLQKLRETNEGLKESIRAIKIHVAEERQNGGTAPEVRVKRKVKEGGKEERRVYKGRPTLVVPVLPDFTSINYEK